MAEKQTLGRMPREAIRMLELPRLPQNMIDAFRALVDLTGTLSDAMDELGIVGVVPAYVLPPVNTGTRIVGQALTIRNIQRTAQIHRAALDKSNTQGESEAHNLAAPGDVLVIEGVMGCSNMGGQSATIARRQGFAARSSMAPCAIPSSIAAWAGPYGAAASRRSQASTGCRRSK
jgi:4-hydroxy-4-methyl-2-oxoglutarate aldolase